MSQLPCPNVDSIALCLLALSLFGVGRRVIEPRGCLDSCGRRVGLGTFLLVLACGLAAGALQSAADLLKVLWHGASLAAAGTGATWIGLSALASLWRLLTRLAQRFGKVIASNRERRRQTRRTRIEERERSRREEEWERMRPWRERQAREAAQRSEIAAQERQADESRRIDARAACEFLYARHAPEIGLRFPRSLYDAFVQTYMNDSFGPAEVERRGGELQTLIEQHLDEVKPRPKRPEPQSIPELAEWFLAEKSRIDALPLDEELKQTHLMQLQYRYAELSDQLLQKALP